MTEPGFVLVASPFTGPFAWSKVAAVLRARGRRVAVHGVDDHDDNDSHALAPPVVLVAHSGGGGRRRAAPAVAGVVGRGAAT